MLIISSYFGNHNSIKKITQTLPMVFKKGFFGKRELLGFLTDSSIPATLLEQSFEVFLNQ